jgi:hypothetical protein
LINHFDSLFKASETDADPFTSLLCFSLPGSLISRPGTLLSKPWNIRLLTSLDSLPFSIFSPEGKQWLHKTVGNEEFNLDILSPSIFGPDGTFGNCSGPSPLPQQFIHLPHKDIARSLLRTYFETCNSFCPTFEEHEFMLWFELEYPVAPGCEAKWACVNATLALACLLDQHFHSKAWLFWKNATLSWEAFMTRAPSLISAQALLTMVSSSIYIICTLLPCTHRILDAVSAWDFSLQSL